MAQYINKDALVAEIDKRLHQLTDAAFDSMIGRNLIEIKDFLDTLEVIDPYEQCIQYASIESGIQAHAEDYSFNIESVLFNQLTKEQQALWRKEIEQACISGGYAGYSLARDPRYKENLEVGEVDLDALVNETFDKYSSVDGYGQLSASFNRSELYSFIKKIARKGEWHEV